MAEPTITFGASNGFGSFAGWDLVSDSATQVDDRATTLDADGNEAASTTYNGRIEYTSTYRCNNNTNTVPATIGALENSRVLTQIQIKTSNTDYAEMTLTGHQHDANAHADTLHQAAHSITVSAAFGAQDFLGGTAGDNAAVASGEVTIAVEHDDIEGATGGHLIGENYHGTIKATTTWSGVPTTAVGAGWDTTSVESPVSNTGFAQTVAAAEKGLDLAAPA